MKGGVLILFVIIFITGCVTAVSERIYTFDSGNDENNYGYIYGRFVNRGTLLSVLQVENIDTHEIIKIPFDNYSHSTIKYSLKIEDPVVKNILLLPTKELSKKERYTHNVMQEKRKDVIRLEGLKFFRLPPGNYQIKGAVFGLVAGLEYDKKQFTKIPPFFTIEAGKLYYVGDWKGLTAQGSYTYGYAGQYGYSYISWSMSGCTDNFVKDTEAMESYYAAWMHLEKVNLAPMLSLPKRYY